MNHTSLSVLTLLVWRPRLLSGGKPLLLIAGEKGGGKTFCLRKWLKLLFGLRADVTALESGKQDGFVAAICSAPVVVFDNVDEHIRWLADHLAQLATGVTFTRRKLYTTNECIEFHPDCFVALTSRTPKFINGRDDVLDRTLVLHTKRRDEFAPENEQLQRIVENRDILWTELLRRLNEIVAYLTDENIAEERVDFRMADFASFALKVGHIFGERDLAQVVLRKLDSARTEMLLADEPICEGLGKWLENPHNHGRKMSSRKLNEELCAIWGWEAGPWPYANARALAQRLSNIAANLKEHFEVGVETDSSNNVLYRFSPKLNR